MCVSIYCPVKPGFSIVIMFDYQMVFHFSRMQLQAGQWLLWFQATPDFMWHMNNGRPNKVGTSKSLRPSLKAWKPTSFQGAFVSGVHGYAPSKFDEEHGNKYTINYKYSIVSAQLLINHWILGHIPRTLRTFWVSAAFSARAWIFGLGTSGGFANEQWP